MQIEMESPVESFCAFTDPEVKSLSSAYTNAEGLD